MKYKSLYRQYRIVYIYIEVLDNAELSANRSGEKRSVRKNLSIKQFTQLAQ